GNDPPVVEAPGDGRLVGPDDVSRVGQSFRAGRVGEPAPVAHVAAAGLAVHALRDAEELVPGDDVVEQARRVVELQDRAVSHVEIPFSSQRSYCAFSSLSSMMAGRSSGPM